MSINRTVAALRDDLTKAEALLASVKREMGGLLPTSKPTLTGYWLLGGYNPIDVETGEFPERVFLGSRIQHGNGTNIIDADGQTWCMDMHSERRSIVYGTFQK